MATPTTQVRPPSSLAWTKKTRDKPAFNAAPLRTEKDFRERAAEVYAEYAKAYKRRFKWLRPALFIPQLAKDLRADIKALLPVLKKCGDWEPDRDAKLKTAPRIVDEDASRRESADFHAVRRHGRTTLNRTSAMPGSAGWPA